MVFTQGKDNYVEDSGYFYDHLISCSVYVYRCGTIWQSHTNLEEPLSGLIRRFRD